MAYELDDEDYDDYEDSYDHYNDYAGDKKASLDKLGFIKESPQRHGAAWVQNEEDYLLMMARRGYSIDRMANALRRSNAGVEMRLILLYERKTKLGNALKFFKTGEISG